MKINKIILTIAAVAAVSVSSLSFSMIVFNNLIQSEPNSSEERKYLKEFEELLDKGEIDVNALVITNTDSHVTPLSLACTRNYVELAKKLLKFKDIDVNKPFYLACSRNYVKLAKKLLTLKNIDVNKGESFGLGYNTSPLYIACDNNHENIVEELLNHPNININEGKNSLYLESASPLYISCQKSNKTIVQKLLEHKGTNGNSDIDINKGITYKSGDTISPLYISCAKGDTTIVKKLLEHKDTNGNSDIDINNGFVSKFEDGRLSKSPLYEACERNYKKIVKLLIANGANVNDPNAIRAASWNPEIRRYLELAKKFDLVSDKNKFIKQYAETEEERNLLAERLAYIEKNLFKFLRKPLTRFRDVEFIWD